MKKDLYGKKFLTTIISGLPRRLLFFLKNLSREYLTVYINITDNQTIGCSLIYIMEKFFVVELKPGSIAERSG